MNRFLITLRKSGAHFYTKSLLICTYEYGLELTNQKKSMVKMSNALLQFRIVIRTALAVNEVNQFDLPNSKENPNFEQ